MPQFAANLTLLYNELPFLARFQAAAEDGFTAVEYLFPYAFSTQALQQALQKNGLQQVLFNAPAGDWEAGERGLACLPGRETEFRAGFELALDYAQALNYPAPGLDPRAAAGHLQRQPPLGRRKGLALEQGRADRAHQPARHARLFPVQTSRGPCAGAGPANAQPQGANGPLPLPNHGR